MSNHTDNSSVQRITSQMISEHYQAHRALTDMGIPHMDGDRRRLTLGQRLAWLRERWAPKTDAEGAA